MPKDKLVTMSIRVSPELANRIRNAIYFTPGMSIVSFVAGPLERAVESMERKNGGPFAQRHTEGLRRGRRPS